MILISCLLIALGISWYVPSDIVPLPTEGFIKTISDITGIHFSNVKIAFDCTVVVISGVLCLMCTGTFGSIGAGTVILAVMVGVINKQILRLFSRPRQ